MADSVLGRNVVTRRGTAQNVVGSTSLCCVGSAGEQAGEQRWLTNLFSQWRQELTPPFRVPSATPSEQFM